MLLTLIITNHLMLAIRRSYGFQVLRSMWRKYLLKTIGDIPLKMSFWKRSQYSTSDMMPSNKLVISGCNLSFILYTVVDHFCLNSM